MSRKYIRLPSVYEAVRWFKNGDHPEDGDEKFVDGQFKGELYEGKIVRYFRHPEISGSIVCEQCGKTMHEHGWIERGNDGCIVCPGDYVVKNVMGKFSVYKPNLFKILFLECKEGKI